MKKKRPLRLRTYTVVSRAVEEGVAYGIQRAYKHTDAPERESLQEHLEHEVVNALCEIIDFGDEG